MQLNVKLYILLQKLLPQHGLSRFAGWMASQRTKWLKNFLIKDFVKRYKVDLSIAKDENIESYPDFNSFFTRKLKNAARPIIAGNKKFTSPVDGTVSQIGKINDDRIIQAKNHDYSLQDLLGGREDLAKNFLHGSFTTLYLAPRDYHRVHMPITGTLKETIYIPGKLFSVNQETAGNLPNLFALNERLVCIFETESGPLAVILVGAMLVSGIETTWPLKLPTTEISSKKYNEEITIEKGEELGHFKMGSTVILLSPKNTVTWSNHLRADSTVQMGSVIGNLY